jgi:hypothetical protein
MLGSLVAKTLMDTSNITEDIPGSYGFLKHPGPGIRTGNNKKKVSKEIKRVREKIALKSKRINRLRLK